VLAGSLGWGHRCSLSRSISISSSSRRKCQSIEPLLGALDTINLRGIDWVIVGGESGPAARPMQVEWVKDIRD
jgi:protein gp37